MTGSGEVERSIANVKPVKDFGFAEARCVDERGGEAGVGLEQGPDLRLVIIQNGGEQLIQSRRGRWRVVFQSGSIESWSVIGNEFHYSVAKALTMPQVTEPRIARARVNCTSAWTFMETRMAGLNHSMGSHAMARR